MTDDVAERAAKAIDKATAWLAVRRRNGQPMSDQEELFLIILDVQVNTLAYLLLGSQTKEIK